MTPEERRNPKIINGSRRSRIANGSGVAIGEVSQLVTNFFQGQKQMKAAMSGGIPGMPAMPGMGAARRAAGKSARKKAKKKAPRSGDPRRAAELARGGGPGQDQAPANGPGQGSPAFRTWAASAAACRRACRPRTWPSSCPRCPRA